MKKIILTLSLLALSITCFSQDNNLTEKYIQDTNNVLKRYVGTWTSQNPENGYQYEFFITKYADTSFIHFKLDILQIRYKITDEKGREIINTENLADGNKYIIFGKEEQGKYAYEYFFSYIGFDYICGQAGDIKISFIKGYSGDLQLEYTPSSEQFFKDCKEKAKHLFPEKLILKKKSS